MSRVTALRTCSWAARGRSPSRRRRRRRGSTRPPTRRRRLRRQHRSADIRCSEGGRRRGRRDVRRLRRLRRRRRTRRTALLALRGPRCGTGPPACGSRSSYPLSPQSAKRVKITSATVSIDSRPQYTECARIRCCSIPPFKRCIYLQMALSRSSRRPFAASSHAGQAVLILACREKERERER